MRSRLVDMLKRAAVAGTMAALVLRALTLASRFLLSLLLARMLTPAEVGQYGLLTAALAFALLAVGLEFYSYTLREMVPATPAQRTHIITNQIVLAAIAWLAMSVLVFIAIMVGFFPPRLAPWFLVILITEHISLEATRILIITWRPVRAYIGIFLRGGIWVYVIAVLMFTTPSTRTLQTVLFWWVLGDILAIVFSAFSMLDLPWRELRHYRPDLSAILTGLRTARPFMLTSASALIISYVDRFAIDRFVGRDELGIYTFYSTILIGTLSLSTSVSHQFLAKIIAGFSGSTQAYRASLRVFFWSLMALASSVTVISGLLMRPMLAMLGLTAYASDIWVFYVMLPGIFMRMLADVPSYALYAARSDSYLLYCNLGAALISTALNFLLIPVFGVYGAAVAGVAASGALFFSLTIVAARGLNKHGVPRTATPLDIPANSDMPYP
jgi:O-antigen/teichoic acid export membrane protein